MDSDMRYDPALPPNREDWTELDEGERIALVSEYHRRAGIRVPNLRVHAAMHVTVENQVLMGEQTPVAATLTRLMTEGLDRHEAIHAIASVLAGVMFDAIKAQGSDDLSAAYFREVAQLTAEKWRAQADDGASS
jgi:hypothetical protein